MGGSGFLIVLLGMFAVMYFLLIRPQKAKQRAAQDMLSRLAPGDEVITIGGIYGDVVEVHDDKVVVEIAEDVHIEVARRAISSIVPPETPETGPGKGSRASTRAGRGRRARGRRRADPVREDKRWGSSAAVPDDVRDPTDIGDRQAVPPVRPPTATTLAVDPPVLISVAVRPDLWRYLIVVVALLGAVAALRSPARRCSGSTCRAASRWFSKRRPHPARR